MNVLLEPRRSQALRCVYCHDALFRDGYSCDGCGARLHPGCRAAIVGCPTLGCMQARPPVVGVRRPGPGVPWWDEWQSPRWVSIAVLCVLVPIFVTIVGLLAWAH